MGLDRIAFTVHDMNCIYREITKDDFGIDGEIEIVVPNDNGVGYRVTGGILKFQSKSGMSYVVEDTLTSFSSPIKKDDLESWYKSDFPVLYIVYHPKDDKLYWKEVRSYVKNTPDIFSLPHKIRFNKSTDEFKSSCFQSLSTLANISSLRITFVEKEKLFANLLEVKRLPWVWFSPTKFGYENQIWRKIRQRGNDNPPPFLIISGRLYTFSNLEDSSSVLRRYCYASKARRFYGIENWWKDDDQRRDYVYLLNQLLGVQLAKCGVEYNKHFKRNYFPRQNEVDEEFKHAWYNVRTNRQAPERITAKMYKYGYDIFWRHLAANLRFKLIGDTWYLQVIPKYYFTEDGSIPYDKDKVGSYTTQIKSMENNQHVLNHILFWADVLSWPTKRSENKDMIEICVENKPVVLIRKLPSWGIANFAISYDPAVYDEPPLTRQLNFDWFNRDEDAEDLEEFEAGEEDEY